MLLQKYLHNNLYFLCQKQLYTKKTNNKTINNKIKIDENKVIGFRSNNHEYNFVLCFNNEKCGKVAESNINSMYDYVYHKETKEKAAITYSRKQQNKKTKYSPHLITKTVNESGLLTTRDHLGIAMVDDIHLDTKKIYFYVTLIHPIYDIEHLSMIYDYLIYNK